MNIKTTLHCADCCRELTVKSTYAEDVTGAPEITVEVEPCESCLFDAVEQYKSDQLAHNMDRIRDERRDRV